GEVGTGRALKRTTRFPSPTVVHAQHRDPAAAQRIRKLAEGPKPWQPDILVAVLWPGSRDGDDCPDGALAAGTFGQRQRAGQRVSRRRLHSHFLRRVGRVGRRGIVRLWLRRHYSCLLAALQGERKLAAALLERSSQLRALF